MTPGLHGENPALCFPVLSVWVLSEIKLKMTSTSNSGEIFSAANDSAFSDEKERDQYTYQQRNVHFGFPSNLTRHCIWSHKSYVFLVEEYGCHASYSWCPLKSLTKSAVMLPMGLLFFQHLPCAVQSLSHGTKIVPNQHCLTPVSETLSSSLFYGWQRDMEQETGSK